MLIINIKITVPFDCDRKIIDILIGLDSDFKLMAENIPQGNKDGPIALQSCFG